mmetsp:Transcript_18840/g.51630  ORF Transcript_18840/g.51630 Transcript_18840/m.51630 type:complete len:94 (+) Transcript_18840:65-346(+)
MDICTAFKRTDGDVATKQDHLTNEQQEQLTMALANTSALFCGKIGHYKNETTHLHVEPNAVPVILEHSLFLKSTSLRSRKNWIIWRRFNAHAW